MPKKPKTHRPPGYKGPKVTAREYDKKRSTVPWRRWYRLARWSNLRKIVLAEEPYCARCAAEGIVKPSDTVNHIRPHKGDFELFWDRDNLEGVCASHHSGDIQREEAEARRRGN